MTGAHEVETYEKFHRYVFEKDPKKIGIMWEELSKNPTEALHSILSLLSNPQHHTLETGFILGAVLGYALRHDPLRVIPMIEGMKFQMKVNNGIQQ